MSRTRPWLLLALALIPLVVLAVRWAAGPQREPVGTDPTQPSISLSSEQLEHRGGSGSAHGSREPVDGGMIVGRVLVGGSGEGMELELGRVELRCVDAPERSAWVDLDADGGFGAELCARSTCARLVHPTLVQREAWVIAAGEGSSARVDRAWLVEGRVEDQAGAVIAGAELALSTADGRRFVARTDMDGDFALSVPALRPCDPCDVERGPPRCSVSGSGSGEGSGGGSGGGSGSARLLASARGYAAVERELELSVSPSVTLRLSAPAPALTGIVLGIGGQAFTSRLQVLATNMDRADERHAAEVDESGRFSFDSLSHARYRVRVVRDGLELVEAQELSPGEFIELRAERDARGRKLDLRLHDAKGEPVAAAQVDGGPFRATHTDVSGQIIALDVLPGAYVLRVRAGSCPAERVDVQVPAYRADAGAEAHVVELRLESDCVHL